MTTIQRNFSTRFLLKPTLRPIIQGTLFTAGFLLAITTSSIAQAQSGLSEMINNGGSINFDNVDNVGGGYGFPLDSGGSQQFFEGGQDRIYFLPEKSESESILEIDETIEAEGINYEDLQRQSIDKIDDRERSDVDE